jgi:hypothetical protein
LALAIGLATLTSGLGPGDHGAEGGAGHKGTARGIVLDSCLLVSALFVVLLVTLFGPDYVPAEIGRAAFALALIRPAADLIALGLVLRFFVKLPMTVFPALAPIAVIVAARFVAIGPGTCPGLGAQIAVTPRLVFARVQAAGALVERQDQDRVRKVGPVGRARTRSPAPPATVVAAIVVAAFAIAGRPPRARSRPQARSCCSGRPAGGGPAFCGR